MVKAMIKCGFAIRRTRGIRCRTISRCSRVCVGGMLMMCLGTGPRCVSRNRKREYATVMIAPHPVIIRVRSAHLYKAANMTSSAMKVG